MRQFIRAVVLSGMLLGVASAAILNIAVAPGEGSINGNVKVDDGGEDLTITLTVDGGDIRGFFFNLDPDVADITSDELGTIVTQICPPFDGGNNCGGGNNMNGTAPTWEWAFAVGEQGDGDIGSTVTFSIKSASTDLTVDYLLNQYVGVRVQAIPPNGDSAKLIGLCASTDESCQEEEQGNVPEPSTYALMGAGLMALVGISRRKRG